MLVRAAQSCPHAGARTCCCGLKGQSADLASLEQPGSQLARFSCWRCKVGNCRGQRAYIVVSEHAPGLDTRHHCFRVAWFQQERCIAIVDGALEMAEAV